MNCPAKHTDVDIPARDWACPECGADVDEGWWVRGWPPDANPECERLHEGDVVVCENCGFETTGRELATWYSKRRDLREQLAAYVHEAWSRWVKHAYEDLSQEEIEKRKKLADIPYWELPEWEKEKDRKEADKILAILVHHE